MGAYAGCGGGCICGAGAGGGTATATRVGDACPLLFGGGGSFGCGGGAAAAAAGAAGAAAAAGGGSFGCGGAAPSAGALAAEAAGAALAAPPVGEPTGLATSAFGGSQVEPEAKGWPVTKGWVSAWRGVHRRDGEIVRSPSTNDNIASRRERSAASSSADAGGLSGGCFVIRSGSVEYLKYFLFRDLATPFSRANVSSSLSSHRAAPAVGAAAAGAAAAAFSASAAAGAAASPFVLGTKNLWPNDAASSISSGGGPRIVMMRWSWRKEGRETRRQRRGEEAWSGLGRDPIAPGCTRSRRGRAADRGRARRRSRRETTCRRGSLGGQPGRERIAPNCARIAPQRIARQDGRSPYSQPRSTSGDR